MADATTGEADLQLIEDIIGRIATNLSMLVDREITIDSVDTSRVTERPAGAGSVHISFKLQFQNKKGDEASGSVLVPLPDALALACYLMMFPEAEVKVQRGKKDLDQSTKDAMLELGNFIGAAVDESLRVFAPSTSVRSDGCQGVRANVRPAFPYDEGSELMVGRAKTRLHEFPSFELIAMFPVLPLGGVADEDDD